MSMRYVAKFDDLSGGWMRGLTRFFVGFQSLINLTQEPLNSAEDILKQQVVAGTGAYWHVPQPIFSPENPSDLAFATLTHSARTRNTRDGGSDVFRD